MAEVKSTLFSSGSSGPSECQSKPSSAVATTPPMVKSDHIRLTFPTYGGPTDNLDPLNYLSKCHDFLALHPLADADTLATFRTVLYGTARDWWEIARSEVTTWSQFETVFLSASLSEDYKDELAECIRTCRQKENEPIRDFAFSYRALCKRWNPALTEANIVKMILKNIKPLLASQLRLTPLKSWCVLVTSLKKTLSSNLNTISKWELEMFIPITNLSPYLTLMIDPNHLSCVGDVRETTFLALAHITVHLVPTLLFLIDSRGRQNTSHDLTKQKGPSGNGSVTIVKTKKGFKPKAQPRHEVPISETSNHT